MAKYSKEQRDRAVDLYIRYERCAADVIHELGYPSRGMLPVWYRERLEEERTGRQSTRGKRYRRYTDEQKQAAVDHYLGHGRRLKRTMRALGYPKSHELLTAWIDELAPGRRGLLSRCLRHVRLLGSGEHLPFPVSHDGRLHAQFGGRLA